MSFDIWLAFALAALIVLATPGPSTLLALAHGFRFGRGRALVTVAGIVSADATHVLIVALGLSALLEWSVQVFGVLKWVGAAYLIYLGIKYWRARPIVAEGDSGGRSGHGRFAEGYLVTLTNPKPILFHIAFFPLFIEAASPQGPQFAVLGTTFVLLAATVLTGYVFGAGALRRVPSAPGRARWMNRITGSLLIGAGVALAGLRR